MHADQRLGRRSIADRIVRLVEAGRLGQPVLLAGPAGSGKEITALGVARRLNCRGPDACSPERPCESCQKAQTFQHPDIRWIGPAPAAYDDLGQAGRVREIFTAKMANPFADTEFGVTSQIVIGNPEQPGPLSVRGLLQFLRRQSFQGRWKVAVVADAHRLNAAAANAFLKTLEEPPPDSVIILLSSRPSSLLPTIRSRCQTITVEPYPEVQLAAILDELRPDADPDARLQAARLADGDARRALALLEPEMRALRDWAARTYYDVAAGRRSAGHEAAENLNAGFLPQADADGTIDEKATKATRVEDPARRRRRALAFCETLATLAAEALACRERGEAWRPRLAGLEEAVRRTAAARTPASLLADLERIERAKHEIDGNLNLGLVMAGLCEDLGDHARRDQLPTSS